MNSYLERFLQVYKEIPPALGLTDIYSDDSPDQLARIGAFAFMMKQSSSSYGSSPVQQTIIVLPPAETGEYVSEEAVHESVRAAAVAKFERELSPEEVTRLSQFVRVHYVQNLWQSSLLTAFESIDPSSAVMVVQAASYRAASVDDVPLTISDPTLPEDSWIKHLIKLGSAIAAIADAKTCYVLLDTGETIPFKKDNRAALEAIPKVGVFGWLRNEEPSQLVAEHIGEWTSMIRNGQIGSAFNSVDQMPVWMDPFKTFVKLQLIQDVAPGNELMRIVKSDSRTLNATEPRAQLKLARIGERSADDDFARSMLNQSIPRLNEEAELAAAAEIAYAISDDELMDSAVLRLDGLFPGSSFTADYRLKVFLSRRKYAEILAAIAASPGNVDPERRFFYQTLASTFLFSGNVQYEFVSDTIAEATPNLGNWARMVCIREALSLGDSAKAISLAMPSVRFPPTRGLTKLLLRSVRSRLLERTRDGRSLVVTGDELVPPIEAIIDYLAVNPDDGEVRQLLTNLISVDTGGTLGLAVIVMIASNRATLTTIDRDSHNASKSLKTEQIDENLQVLKNIMEWLSKESPIILAEAKLPKDLITVPADDLFEIVHHAVRSDEDLRDEAASRVFESMLMVGYVLAPYTSNPNEDLDLVRYAGARFKAANKAQRGRDFAEQALQITRGHVMRRRLAWLAFADIYLRTLSLTEALIGIACAYTNKTPITPEQMFQEGYVQIRILRDLRFIEPATQLLGFLKALCNDLGLGDRYQQRLRTVEFQLIAKDERLPLDSDPTRLLDLIEALASHCRDLEDTGEESAPAVAMLAHYANLAASYGLVIAPETRKTLKDKLADLPAATAALLQALDPENTTAVELLSIGRTLELARNAEDIAFDLKQLAIAARRFLDSGLDSNDPSATAFAIECLADHALKGSLIGTAESPFSEVSSTLQKCYDLSSLGASVVLIGISETGQLLRVTVTDRKADAPIRENNSVFSMEKFRKWASTYPYGYAKVTDPMNLFHTTLSGIGLSYVPNGPTIFLLDNSLHQMPPNLMMLGDRFAGRQYAIAMAPSVSWLWRIQTVPLKTGKRRAWISIEQGEGRDAALATVAERAKECLDTHGFATDHTAILPADMDDCEIAIVAAHGGILPEGRYIQRLSDDADLAVYPNTLAMALSGSSIVILFVCSGGRFDSHPHAETSVGLVHQLLDYGCATVIASPWPLDTRVPSHWLMEFMKHWSNGQTAMQSNFEANNYVQTQMGDSPCESLAMNVFGDPFRKMTPRDENASTSN